MGESGASAGPSTSVGGEWSLISTRGELPRPSSTRVDDRSSFHARETGGSERASRDLKACSGMIEESRKPSTR